MTAANLCVLLIVGVSFSAVLGKNSYFEHYFSKYHNYKSSSTTPSVSTTSESSTSEEEIISNSQDDIFSKETSSTEGDKETNFISNTTVLQNGPNGSSTEYLFVARVATIVGSIIFIVLVLGCIVCCCPRCCAGTERRGFILGNRVAEVLPQPVITPAPQQPIVQHIPPEFTQETVQQFPPQYQQPLLPPTQYAPMQQGYHYSPIQPQNSYSPVQLQTNYSPVHPGFQNPSNLQFYNPPEAPPPYEPTAPKM